MSTSVTLAALSSAIGHAQRATSAAEGLADQLVEERSLTEPPSRAVPSLAPPREASAPSEGQAKMPVIVPKVRAPDPKPVEPTSALLPQFEEPPNVGGGWDVEDLAIETEEMPSAGIQETTGPVPGPTSNGAAPPSQPGSSTVNPATGEDAGAGSSPGGDIIDDGWDVEDLGDGDTSGWEADAPAGQPTDAMTDFNAEPGRVVADTIANRQSCDPRPIVREIMASDGVWSGDCAEFISAVKAGYSRSPIRGSLQAVWENLCLMFGYPDGISSLIPLTPTTTDNFVEQLVRDGMELSSQTWGLEGSAPSMAEIDTLHNMRDGIASQLSALDWLCLVWVYRVSATGSSPLTDAMVDCYLDAAQSAGFNTSEQLLTTLRPFPEPSQVQCAVPYLLEATWEDAGDLVDGLLRQRSQQTHMSSPSEADEFSLV